MQIEEALLIIPALVRALNEGTSQETVLSIAALVGDASVCQALVDEGGVAALLPLLGDSTLIEPTFVALSAVALKSVEGARQVRPCVVPCGLEQARPSSCV